MAGEEDGPTVNPPVNAGRTKADAGPDAEARAEPRCPDCALEGMEHIVSRQSQRRGKSRHPLFVVVYCAGCGHVYDVVAKHVFSVPVTPRLVLPDLKPER